MQSRRLFWGTVFLFAPIFLIALAAPNPRGEAAEAAGNLARNDPDARRSAPAKVATTEIVGGPIAGLDFEAQSAFRLGRSLFRKEFTPANQGQAALDGLGPLFNARSCAQCHINDGRGTLPPPLEASAAAPGPGPILSMILKFTPPHKIFGKQLQTHGVNGSSGEGQVIVSYTERKVAFPDGEIAHLRKPVFAVAGEQSDQILPEQISGARIASPMFGLGALAAIADAELRKHHDPEDADGDGISGRMRMVFSPHLGADRPGRFGWKADMATLEDQVATALALDMGLSSPLLVLPSGDCTMMQPACLNSANGEQTPFAGPEISSASLGWLTSYSAFLAAPSPRPGAGDPAGQLLFDNSGCAACHTPSYVLPDSGKVPQFRGQTIYPYTDLALHDLGPELADRAADDGLDPAEWRTPPLWGVGLSHAINGNSGLLHDGRARSVSEAILWHGGEAAASRDKYMSLAKSDRQRLLDFVSAL